MSKLSIARDAAGIKTQVDLARLLREEEQISIHHSLISHYESGRATPCMKKAIAIVNILGRRGVDSTVTELFGGDGVTGASHA